MPLDEFRVLKSYIQDGIEGLRVAANGPRAFRRLVAYLYHFGYLLLRDGAPL